MKLYTFVLEFRGGTYISQFEGETAHNAALIWANNLKTKGITHLRKKHKKLLLAELSENLLVNLSGVKNVWYDSFLIGKHLVLLNIVQTDAK